MKYYYDCEFLEGDVPIKFLGYNIPKWLIKPNNTIQPISIGLVSSDGREFYAISKDFNLKEAWNRYDLKPDINNGGMKKVYWIRENVLKTIHYELSIKERAHHFSYEKWCNLITIRENGVYSDRHYKTLKSLINKYGKTNKQIAEEVVRFCYEGSINGYAPPLEGNGSKTPINFYGYYSAYDHVALCWLFGKMIDLPKGFPMYTIDLKQMLDGKAMIYDDDQYSNLDLDGKIDYLKTNSKYPKQTNEHNALADARWNKLLHEFLKSI